MHSFERGCEIAATLINSILPRDEHLRQAALDAEVQAKVAQQELEEDCQASGIDNSEYH